MQYIFVKESLPDMIDSHSQTPFCIKGRGLGHGHRAVCCLNHGGNKPVTMQYTQATEGKFERVNLKC